jgi:hypothetical protein
MRGLRRQRMQFITASSNTCVARRLTFFCNLHGQFLASAEQNLCAVYGEYAKLTAFHAVKTAVRSWC